MWNTLVICHYKLRFIALVLALSFVLTGILMLVTFTEYAPRWKQNTLELTTPKLPKTRLNVVQAGSFDARNETFDCVTKRLDGLTFPVCVYSADIDIYVSGMLVRDDYFEGDEVSRFLRLLKFDWRLQFVDIGANIGIFSLPAARLTQVLAVEPNWSSMVRLAKAVDLGSVSSNTTLVHNAVSDVRTEINMGVDTTNQGHAFLINSTECTKTPDGTLCRSLSKTSTILLNDLLPLMRSTAALLKVDVEGHEVNVFTESSAGQFFDQVDVRLVFIEWMQCRRHSSAVVQRLFAFFRTRSYVAFDTRNNAELLTHYRSWPNNILFKKTSYINYHF